MLNNDTCGSSFYMQTMPLDGTAQTVTTNTLPYSQYWPYQYQTYYPDYSLTGRVAELEGEVKVLREMVAALLSNKPTPRKRAKKHA